MQNALNALAPCFVLLLQAAAFVKTRDGVELYVAFYRVAEGEIAVEVQPRHGNSVSFHEHAHLILLAAAGLAPPQQEHGRRVIHLAHSPVPWELPVLPRGLRNQCVVVGDREQVVYLVRKPTNDGAGPQQAYLEIKDMELPPVGNPARRETKLCVKLPRDFQHSMPEEIVFLQTAEENAERVVIKRIEKTSAFPGTEIDPLVEVAAMQFFAKEGNDHVLPFLEALEDDSHVYIVTPYKERGDLLGYILEEDPNEPQVRGMFSKVVANLAHLQDHHGCHLDIKGENILVGENGTILIDMATSLRVAVSRDGHHFLRSSGRRVGTIRYMAPEIWRGDVFFDGFKVDIWAMGVLLFVMLARGFPYEAPESADPCYQYWVLGGGLDKDERLQHFDKQARELLKGMLDPNAAQRFTLEEVKEHFTRWSP